MDSNHHRWTVCVVSFDGQNVASRTATKAFRHPLHLKTAHVA
jgi:hypothetical protein